MRFCDLFKPYSPEIHGDIEKYLEEHDGFQTDNLFQGSKYFFKIKDMELIVPKQTIIRMDQSPIPDLSYFVNSNYQLESMGRGIENMSLVGAEKGSV